MWIQIFSFSFCFVSHFYVSFPFYSYITYLFLESIENAFFLATYVKKLNFNHIRFHLCRNLSDIFYFFRRENSIEWIFVILCKDTQSCFIFNICQDHQGYLTYVPRPMKSFLKFSGIKTYFWPISVKKWRRQMKFLEVKLIRNSGLNRFILTTFINQRN